MTNGWERELSFDELFLNWTRGKENVRVRFSGFTMLASICWRLDYADFGYFCYHRLDGPAIYEFETTPRERSQLLSAKSPEEYDYDWETPRTATWHVLEANIHTVLACHSLPCKFPKVGPEDLIRIYKHYRNFNHIRKIAELLNIDIGNLRNLDLIGELCDE